MATIITLNWPATLPAPVEFQQNQFKVAGTGPVECVTTTISTARNMLNAYLVEKTGFPALPLLPVQAYVNELDALKWKGILYRVPSRFPDIVIPFVSKEKWSPRGFMLPTSQAIRALKRIRNEFLQHFGIAFKIRQIAYSSIEEIAENLSAGNLVLLHGMYPPQGKEQGFLGGAPHTYGPVTEVDFERKRIKAIDTGSMPINISSFEEFHAFWGQRSRLNLYTKPNTITILIPDL